MRGWRSIGNTLMTQPGRLASERGVAEGMVRGLMKATRFTLLQPEDALKIFLKAVPEAALSKTAGEQARIGLGMYRLAATAAKAHARPVGWSDPGGLCVDAGSDHEVSRGARGPAAGARGGFHQ